MSAPLALCACGKPAAWRGHNDGANLCDDCMTWGHEPIWAAVNLPFSAGLIARRRQVVASLALAGDMEADDLQTARWLATLEAAEKERDALRAAVQAFCANASVCFVTDCKDHPHDWRTLAALLPGGVAPFLACKEDDL